MSEQTAVGNFQMNLPAPNGASVSISGYIYTGDDLEVLNVRMDVAREALVRQQAILELPEIEKKIEMYETMLDQHRKAYAALLEKKRGKTRLASQEEAQLTNLPIQVKSIEAELEKGKATVAKLKKVA
jgi:hypothetical protein